MPTFFFRNPEFRSAPSLDLSRFVAAAMHLSIPFLMYSAMYKGMIYVWLSRFLQLEELNDNRKILYLSLDIFYSIRWAVGVLIMQGELTLGVAVFVSMKHLLFDEFGYIVGSMMVNSWGYRTGELTARDYACAFLMILAGILQHASELQRWFFKKDSRNKGKVHTSGLFQYARGINHTGHILRDVAHILLSPHLFLVLFYPVADYDLSCQVVPETQKHMKNKYGKQWDIYMQKTPHLFIPGVV